MENELNHKVGQFDPRQKKYKYCAMKLSQFKYVKSNH